MPTRWIYPSEGPNGEFAATYRKYGFGSLHLAKECEQVKHIPTGKLVWISTGDAELLRSGARAPQKVIVCEGTHQPEYIVHAADLEI